MSTFTPSNGCCDNSNVDSVAIKQLQSQIDSLIAAVDNLNADLASHEQSLVSSVDTHGVNTKYGNVLGAISRLEATVDSLASTEYVDDSVAGLASTSYVDTAVAGKATSASVAELAGTVASNKDSVDGDIATLTDSIRQLQAAVATLQSYSDEINADFLRINKVILAVTKFVNYTDFTKIDPVGLVYTDVEGIRYYIFGKLSDDWTQSNYTPARGNLSKPATIYLKYQNTNGFDAVINAVCTETADGYAGSMTATVSKGSFTWEGLSFHLLESTSYDEGKHVIYTAFTCAQSLPEYIAGGLAENMIYAWGTDFVPLYNPTSVMPVEAIVCTAEIPYSSNAVTVMSDIVVNNITFTQLPTYEEGENSYPMISLKQLAEFLPIGLCMNMWLNPPSAVNIPAGWLACDGRTIANIDELTADEKATLSRMLGSTTLPVADNMIVLAYYPFARS